jgi:hypothetical protein
MSRSEVGVALPAALLTTALLAGAGVGLSVSTAADETHSLVAATPEAASTPETAATSPSSDPTCEAEASASAWPAAESPAVPTPSTTAASESAEPDTRRGSASR